MDESMVSVDGAYRPHGFAGQRMCVVPRPEVDAALGRPITGHLTVTDAGFFPRASGHGRVRAGGVAETIVLVCTAGRGVVQLGTEEHPLSPGDCAVIPSGTPHRYHADHDEPWTIWWVHVRGSDVADLADARRPVSRLRSPERATALIDEIVGLLERRPSPTALVAASGLAWQLFTRIAVDATLPPAGSPLERAMRYLEDRVEGSISVAELAGLVGVSASHLSALFHRATGGGPAAFHTSMRMARARMLLDTTPASVAEIAAAVGYTDPLYFSRHFRRLHGLSPKAYRAEAKG